MYVSMYLCIYVFMYLCIYVSTIYIYIYIFIRGKPLVEHYLSKTCVLQKW